MLALFYSLALHIRLRLGYWPSTMQSYRPELVLHEVSARMALSLLYGSVIFMLGPA